MANPDNIPTVEFRDFAREVVNEFVLPTQIAQVIEETGAIAIMSIVAGGKGTICGYLEEWGVGEPTISHTTRDPEPRDLIDPSDPESHPRLNTYHFVDQAYMVGAIMASDMLEVAFVHGEMYGTSLESLTSVAAQGKRPLLDIDIQGVRHLKREAEDMPAFFIVPPSLDEWLARWSRRDGLTLPEDKFYRRLDSAHKESKGAGDMAFDRTAKLVVNDQSRAAAHRVNRALRTGNFDNSLDDQLQLEKFILELESTSPEQMWERFHRTN